MKVEWLVAKYMPDLRRREPRNVGVILCVGDQVLSRFVGERPDGKIDGRVARGTVEAAENYKAWVSYWKRSASQLTDPTLSALDLQPRVADNYFLEFGGERLVGAELTEASALLADLYEILVEPSQPSVALGVAELAERVIKRAGLSAAVETNKRLDIPTARASDAFFFDYAYQNGKLNLMQRLTLVPEDKGAWKDVHNAAWTFREIATNFTDPFSLIALVRVPEPAEDTHRQLALVGELATVVNVQDEEPAALQLRSLVGLP